jgi:hypothetical protein
VGACELSSGNFTEHEDVSLRLPRVPVGLGSRVLRRPLQAASAPAVPIVSVHA